MIDATGGASAAGHITGGHHRPDRARAMAPVAELLGMDAESLQEQLRSGSSLSELAETQGIDRGQLLDAISQGLQAAKPADAPEPPGGLMGMAERIADRTGPPGPPPGPRPGQDDDAASRLTSLAELLGTDVDTLREQLSQGLAGLDGMLGGRSGYDGDQTWSLRQGLSVDVTA